MAAEQASAQHPKVKKNTVKKNAPRVAAIAPEREPSARRDSPNANEPEPEPEPEPESKPEPEHEGNESGSKVKRRKGVGQKKRRMYPHSS